jgi:hypothetical protein
MNRRIAQLAFACASMVLLGYEARLLHQVLTLRTPTRDIHGDQPIVVNEFGDGVLVSQLFRMNVDGLSAISVQLASDRPAAVRVFCQLQQAYDESPDKYTDLRTWTQKLARVSDLDWYRLEFPPVPESHGRLYVLRLQLFDVRDAAVPPRPKSVSSSTGAPHIVIAASADNVREGGVLWIGEARQVGSLFLRGHVDGETAYARFQQTLAPKLPRPFRSWRIQASIVIAYHWALLTFLYAMLLGDTVPQQREDDSRPA